MITAGGLGGRDRRAGEVNRAAVRPGADDPVPTWRRAVRYSSVLRRAAGDTFEASVLDEIDCIHRTDEGQTAGKNGQARFGFCSHRLKSNGLWPIHFETCQSPSNPYSPHPPMSV